MKKFLYLCLSLMCVAFMFFSCANPLGESTRPKDVNIVDFNGIPIYITQGAQIIQSKSDIADAEYFTLSAQKGNAQYEMYVESYKENDLITKSNTYTMSGDLFSTTYYHNEDVIAEEFPPIVDEDDYDIEPDASRQRGEKYSACVKRVHKAVKEAAETNNSFQCDLIAPLISCGTFAALAAIVECAQYGNDVK